VCVLEIISETTSHLLEGTTEHEYDQLWKRLPRPPKTWKYLPYYVQRDAGIRDGLDDDPRNGQQAADCGNGED
jgi:hypothetical protein